MAIETKTLTQPLCRKLPEGRYKDAATPGLYFTVGKSARTFALNVKVKGKVQYHKLGKMSDGVTITEARLRAARARDLLATGQQVQQTQTALSPETDLGMTFKEAWDKYVEEHLSGNRSGAKSASFVEHNALAEFASRSLKSITRAEARAYGERLKKDINKRRNAKLVANGKPPEENAGHATTKSTLVALKGFFNWCISRDWVDANPFHKTMPQLSIESRDRVLTPEELAIVMDALGDHPSPTYRGVIDTLIYTGMRVSEVTALRFGWIDFERGLITLPREVCKNKKVNLVTLPGRVVDIFNELRHLAETDPELSKSGAVNEAFVFSTGSNNRYQGLSKDRAKLQSIIEGIDPNFEKWVQHDLRRSVATGAAILGMSEEKIERGLLRHYPEALKGTYQLQKYVPEVRAVLDKWVEQIDQAQAAWEEVRRGVIWANNNPETRAAYQKLNDENEKLHGRIVGLKPNANGKGGEIIREGGVLNQDAANAEIAPQGSRYGRAHSKRKRPN